MQATHKHTLAAIESLASEEWATATNALVKAVHAVGFIEPQEDDYTVVVFADKPTTGYLANDYSTNGISVYKSAVESMVWALSEDPTVQKVTVNTLVVYRRPDLDTGVDHEALKGVLS